MMTTPFFPLPEGIDIERIESSTNQLHIWLFRRHRVALCPCCDHPSERVHSHYCRTIADLACSGQQVTLFLMVRKFFCDSATCSRRIFAERFPGLVRSYARMTERLIQAVQAIGAVAGGKPGSRLTRSLQIPTQPRTVLRRFLEMTLPPPSSVRILGVDDWAWKKGQRYGTILVDLERHCPIAILPNRTADGFASWLREHPEVEVISRDRGAIYIDGATRGAPDAVQIADRFHIVMNLREVVESIMKRLRSSLVTILPTPESPPSLAPIPHERLTRQAQRYAQFAQIKRWHEEGLARDEISRRSGMSIRNITRYLRLQQCPQYGRKRKVPLDPHLPYLQKRFAEGCDNAAHLYRELRELGYQGTYALVAEYVRCLKSPEAFASVITTPVKQQHTYRPKVVAWWIVKSATLATHEQAALEQILEGNAEIRRTKELAIQLRQIIAERQEERLEPWLCQAESSAIKEWERFAWGMRQDQAAITAALQCAWSNGPVEGFINRLKTIKRQMYGRAGVDLLTHRMMGEAFSVASVPCC